VIACEAGLIHENMPIPVDVKEPGKRSGSRAAVQLDAVR